MQQNLVSLIYFILLSLIHQNGQTETNPLLRIFPKTSKWKPKINTLEILKTPVMVGDGGGNSGKPWWGRKVQTEGSKWPNDQEF